MSRDIRALAEQDGVRFQARPVANKDGGEYAGGPCPLCKAGEDRFHIWPAARNPNFWCRQCDAKGDAIDYIKRVRGLTFADAKVLLGEDMPAAKGERPSLRLVKSQGPESGRTTYRYGLPAGEVLEHVRIDYQDGSKRFVWRRNGKDGLGGFDVNDVPLWRIADVLAAPADAPVIITEGQKCADALAAVGMLAVGTCGSDTTPNPEVLASLAGHPVVLWADHDLDPKKNRCGQRHMARIAERLAGLDVQPLMVEWVDGPDGGDAADFLASGHSADDVRSLLATAKPPADGKPITVARGEHLYELEMPLVGIGTVHIIAGDVQRGRNAQGSMFGADLEVRLIAPGVRTDPWPGHANLMSPSNRDALAKALGHHFGLHDLPWADVLTTTTNQLRRAYATFDPSSDVFDIDLPPNDVRWSVEKLVEEGQPTIFFGDGESLKSYLALGIAVSKALGLPDFCELRTTMGSALWLDYETDGITVRRRWNRVLAGLDMKPCPGLLSYWPAKGRALRDIKDGIRRRVQEEGLRLLIVDSALVACGGNPLDPQMVGDYFASLAEIGVTSITIAHVSKADVDGSQDAPFGSIMWKTQARSCWNIRKPAETEASVYHLGAHHKKANNGVRFKSLGFRVTFADDDMGAVTFEAEDPHETAAVADNIPLRDRILRALEDGGGWQPTAVEIADRLFGGGHAAHDDGEVRQVNRALGTMRGSRVVELKGPGRAKVWALIPRASKAS